MLKKVEVELDISGIDVAFSGCTFISIIIFENTIFSISVGDSKIILCNGITTSQLNTLHKPDHPI
jgi:serine/threonine protein phosphatase PrpC